MPHAFEFPRVRRSVVELMRRQRFPGWGRRIVDELVAFSLLRAVRTICRLSGRSSRLKPGLASVVGTLDDLAEPVAMLRSVDAFRIGRGTLRMIDLPSSEMRSVHFPFLPLSVGRQYECPFSCACENPNFAHWCSPLICESVIHFLGKNKSSSLRFVFLQCRSNRARSNDYILPIRDYSCPSHTSHSCSFVDESFIPHLTHWAS